MMRALRLAILGSSNGTNMLAIISAIENKTLNASIELVFSNKLDAGILSRAQQYNLPTLFLDPKGSTRECYDNTISKELQAREIDLIVLIGYMRVLSTALTEQWQNKIINVHPSLLPDFAGGMDRQVHQAVLDAGSQQSGCTVHYVTEILDGGPILVQKHCPVFSEDTVESLRNRVQALEGLALIESIQKIQEQWCYESVDICFEQARHY